MSNEAFDLAVRVAECVAPDEVDLVPVLLEAATKRGVAWEALLKPERRSRLGGFGGELGATVMPIILECLKGVGIYIQPTIQTVGAAFAIAHVLRQWRGTASPAGTGQQPDTGLADLRATLERLREQLQQRGQTPQQATETVDTVLDTLNQAPQATVILLHSLQGPRA